MIIGDFAGEDAIFFELFIDGFGITDDFTSVFFDGLLGFGIAAHVVDAVLESGRGDIVEKTGESLFFVASETPDDEGDADAMLENGAEMGEIIEGAIVHADHADAGEALELGSGDVFEEPGRELGREDFEIFAGGWGEVAKRFVFAGDDVDGFVGATTEETALYGSRFDGGGNWRGGDRHRGFDGGRLFDCGFGDWFDLRSVVGDRNGGFAAGWTVINL